MTVDILPIGIVAFPGSAISVNLTDKARKMGTPVPFDPCGASSNGLRHARICPF
jgi:hypothetical protein